ncbi:MAG: tetratricopeptide repeat protein [Sphingomonadales bacterium]|jgi:hypothetical protein
MPADDTFLREVDEGVRRDQLLALWQRWGRLGIAALLLALAALAGFLFWQEQQKKAADEMGERFNTAVTQLEVGEGARARPVLKELAAGSNAGYAAMAQLVLANDALAGGDTAAAIKAYDAVAANTKLPQPVRDAALLKSVRLGFDKETPAAVIARLQPLAVPGNPWFANAAELVALAHIKAGKPDAAKPLLIAVVKDDTASPAIRTRLANLAITLGVDAAQLQPAQTGALAK